MTISKWIKKVLGKYVKYNKTTKGYQCVDLAKSYCVDVMDFYTKYPSLQANWAWGDARCWYEDYDKHKELVLNFTKMPNTASFTPVEGDILVFTEKTKYGHICVAYNNKSTTKKIYSIDQNYPTGSKVRYCTHTYTSEGFLGSLRPKNRKVTYDVNIRKKPSMSGEIIGEKKAGETVFIYELDSSGKWARIGKGEWISYKYIKELGA